MKTWKPNLEVLEDRLALSGSPLGVPSGLSPAKGNYIAQFEINDYLFSRADARRDINDMFETRVQFEDVHVGADKLKTAPGSDSTDTVSVLLGKGDGSLMATVWDDDWDTPKNRGLPKPDVFNPTVLGGTAAKSGSRAAKGGGEVAMEETTLQTKPANATVNVNDLIWFWR